MAEDGHRAGFGAAAALAAGVLFLRSRPRSR